MTIAFNKKDLGFDVNSPCVTWEKNSNCSFQGRQFTANPSDIVQFYTQSSIQSRPTTVCTGDTTVQGLIYNGTQLVPLK